MIKVKRINNEVVKPVPLPHNHDEDKRPIKGVDLFSELYANIFIVAKKKSGKTSVIYKIVRQCATKETKVVVFCSTLDKDLNHKAIKDYCKSKDIDYCGYTSMKDNGDIDILDELIKELQFNAQHQEEEEEEEEQPKQKNIVLFDESEEEEEYKPRKNKYRAPEYIIILDDLSNELKSKTLTKLCKMNRHFKFKIVISTQYLHDVLPETIKQQDYILVFKGQPQEKLEKIYKDADISIDFVIFEKIYKNATEKKYSFLYIDVRNELFRRNFDKSYDIAAELLD